MRTMLIVTSLVVVVGLCASQGFAATQAGQSELAFEGLLQSFDMGDDDDSKRSSFNLSTTYNYFAMDTLSVGGTFTWQHDGNGTETNWYFLYARTDYYFAASDTLAPYAGPHLGIIYYKYGDDGEDDSAFLYGLQVGVKYFVQENMSLNVEGTWDLYTVADSDQDVTVLSLKVGFSVYF